MLKGTYKIQSELATSPAYRKLKACAAGAPANGQNVITYESDGTVEEMWYFDGSRLRSAGNRKYCLDRYAASTYLDNADIWAVSSSDSASQVVTITKNSDETYKIKLSTPVNGVDYYLTAKSNANGTATGKSKTSSGNVYWAPATGGLDQRWDFIEVDPSSSAVTINGIKVPLPEYPVGSYWTKDGEPTDMAGSNSKDFNGKQCAGFARYVYYCMWGDDYYGNPAVENDRKLNGNAADFSGINVGARLSCKEPPDNHSMILLAKDSKGVTVYDANWELDCGVHIYNYSYSDFKDKMKIIKTSSYTP